MYFHKDIKEEILDYSIGHIGDLELIRIDNAALVGKGNDKSVVWLGQNFFDNNFDKTQVINANLLITNLKDLSSIQFSNGVIVRTKNPRLLFSKILTKLFLPKVKYGIHKSSVIHPLAKIHDEVYIGPNCTIGKVKIGKGTEISGNTFIHDNVEIGEDCLIDSCCVIGADGFGHIKDENNEWFKFPHLGGTVIEDNVEIGANTYITKGALGNTIIKRGAKIALSACVGHNVVIGENTIVLSNAIIGGSTVVGRDSWISITASIKDGLMIGDNAVIGMGAVVTKSVESNKTVVGNPAKELVRK